VDAKEKRKWLWVGKIARKTLVKAVDLIHEDMPVLEFVEKLENYIKSYASPAFPVNVSINHVAAHYSPGIYDSTVIPGDSIVKVDVGVHKDGYIADAAISIPLNRDYEELSRASFEALMEAEKAIAPGVKTGSIGAFIEHVILSYGFKPIRNLTGHKISRFNLHAGKSVPNTKTAFSDKIEEDEVYAIEPFATDGAGYVVELSEGFIYRIISARRTGDKKLDSILREMWRRFRGLPFSERWVADFVGKEKAKDLLTALLKKKVIMVYPVLVEKERGFVSQFEDTVIVTREGPIVTTGIAELAREIL